MAEKVKVYRFRRYDISQDASPVPPRWGTREAIRQRRGTVLEDTGVEVDATNLDGDGMTNPGFDPTAGGR